MYLIFFQKRFVETDNDTEKPTIAEMSKITAETWRNDLSENDRLVILSFSIKSIKERKENYNKMLYTKICILY